MGTLLINIAFASALISSVCYFAANGGKEKFIRYGRTFYHIAAVFVISSAAYLLYLIITHRFEFTYVWNYSARDLPWNLLISTFYAGQEGSFHLWAFLTAVLGIFLLSYLANRDAEIKSPHHKDKYEPLVMGLYSLILSFLAFILVIKSPYMMVWESFPKDVSIGFVPEDGRGLNPLLQNFWMTIHPPILFTGFTSLAVPFCFAVAALIKNEYSRWMKLGLPWTLFGGMILGLGIMLGGYWAYGVLGWGGYWGWDPVENSSFVPWIVIVAAIHAMVSEEKTGKFKKTSLVLCIVAYVLVLYSTFLTRSGVLGDASVHSFVDPGQEVYLFLIVFLSLFGGGGIAMVLFRLKSLKTTESEQQSQLLSRESALFVGAITLCAAALVIAIGTSWPIIAKGTVEPEFYNRMNLPLAILIASINGFSILLKWRYSEEKQFLNSLYFPLGFTALVTIVLVIIGVRDFIIALLAAASFFALFINLEIAYRIFTKDKVKSGPNIAHTGLMVLFLGIIGSARYSEEVNVSLPLNETKQALGYNLTYKGATPIKGDEEKFHFNVVVEKEGRGFLLQPVMYYSEYSEGVMKNPDIANLVTKDLYLSPMALETPQDISSSDMISLKKGEEKEIHGMKVKFIDFDRSKFNRDAMQEGKDNIMGAELEVIIDGKIHKVVAEQKITSSGSENIPSKISANDKYTFYLLQLAVAGESSVDIAVVDESMPKTDSPETLVLTASIKPFINLVWGGTIIMVLGFFASLLRRYRLIKSGRTGSEPREENTAKHSKNGRPRKKTHLLEQE
jgi:cytochrome c-type biogenesis protein CcmF